MKKIGLLCLILITVACKNVKKEAKNIEEPVVTEKAPDVKLYTFDGGTVLVNKLEIFSQGELYNGESKQLADPFYVIVHPKGNLIWDAGLAEGLVGQEPFTTPNGAFTVSRKDSVVNQLKTIGLSLEDFKYIALSHTHFDHSGSAYAFKKSTWIVQESEYNFVTSEEQKEKNATNYNAIKELVNVKKINGDFDVFDDGSVIIKLMPGHTPGHQVLYLNLANEGAILLTGDLYHFQENRDNKGVPSFNSNVEQTLKSMEDFEKFAKEKNARIIIQHEAKDFVKSPKIPEYLN